MNKEKGDSLPAEYQEAIEKLSGKEASLGAAEAFANNVVEKRDKITAAGGQFVELEASAITEMQADADTVAQAWIENMSKDGFDAAAYLADAKAFAANYAG